MVRVTDRVGVTVRVGVRVRSSFLETSAPEPDISTGRTCHNVTAQVGGRFRVRVRGEMVTCY